MKAFSENNEAKRKKDIERPDIPEITPKPKERPVTKPEKPDVIPPDLEPGKPGPEISPVKK